jgi:hypothetical protein
MVAAAQGPPSDDGGQPGAATAAKDYGQPARCDAVEAYCTFAALADACLDPAGPAADGAGGCAAWRAAAAAFAARGLRKWLFRKSNG